MNKKAKLQQPQKQKGNKLLTPNDTRETHPEQQSPIFSLRYLDPEYCITKCDKNEQAQFAVKIHRLSQLTWCQINSQDRHKLGYEKIARDSIKRPIPKSITNEVNFIAFPFSGMKPMVGYRDGAIFYVIWLCRCCCLFKIYEKYFNTQIVNEDE